MWQGDGGEKKRTGGVATGGAWLPRIELSSGMASGEARIGRDSSKQKKKGRGYKLRKIKSWEWNGKTSVGKGQIRTKTRNFWGWVVKGNESGTEGD